MFKVKNEIIEKETRTIKRYCTACKCLWAHPLIIKSTEIIKIVIFKEVKNQLIKSPFAVCHGMNNLPRCGGCLLFVF